jgi:hypothetical protein
MGVCKSFECQIKVLWTLHRPKIEENGKVSHYYTFMNYYFFFQTL